MQFSSISILRPISSIRAGRLVARAEGEQNTQASVPTTTTSDVSPPEVSSTPVTAGAGVVNEKTSPGFGDLMNFSGMAPEVINGRLAMLGFVAALGAELASQESVAQQFFDNPLVITLVGITFILGSLYPMFQNKTDKQLGPFTKTAEILNGRAAMIGLAAMIIIELVKGSALF